MKTNPLYKARMNMFPTGKLGEPAFKPGQLVIDKRDKKKYKVPEEKDFPDGCNWSARLCMFCHNGIREAHHEYVLMKLDSLDQTTGEIDTHICEQSLKLAKK